MTQPLNKEKIKFDTVEEFRVQTIKKWRGIPEGASIVIQKASRKYFCGLWPNMTHTTVIIIPKSICKGYGYNKG
jgi:hypothetical protein